MSPRQADVAIVGAGIVGLAHALASARRGRSVVVFERDERAVGASIRNFGLIWPIGQTGELVDDALRSREIWLDVARSSDLWLVDSGSLHLAYHPDELAVLEEFAGSGRECQLLSAAEVSKRSSVVRTSGLLGGLWSPTELNVDPRQAIPAVAALLAEQGVTFRFGSAVREISLPHVRTSQEDWEVEQVYVCSGNEFQVLYPSVFADAGIRRCKLQMMRTVQQPSGWALGPTLCAGLTLLHYPAFRSCVGLPALRSRLEEQLPFHLEHGIHVLVSQTRLGEVTIGDSHEYGLTHDPFEYEAVNEAILDYFGGFAEVPRPEIAERWHGVYPSLPSGDPYLIAKPEPGVTIVNGLGGAGMTLSFGLAERLLGEG